MTQHKWQFGEWSVLCGWDRPLQYFFLDISKECGCDAADECDKCKGSGEVYLYNNLEDRKFTNERGGMTLDQVFDVLNKFDIDYPTHLRETLEAEGRLNMGNKISRWGLQDGEWVSWGTTNV